MDEDIVYFFLPFTESLNFHPNNKAYNFTVKVPERTSLSGDWEVGICDFCASTVTNETLYLFSDIVNYSYVRNSMQGILRLLPQTNLNKYQLFNKIYYLPKPKFQSNSNIHKEQEPPVCK